MPKERARNISREDSPRDDIAKRPPTRRRMVYAVEDLPDDIIEAILAAEPPPEAAQYNWELTADDGPDAGAGRRRREGRRNG